MAYDTEDHGQQSRPRHGSPTFYKLLEEMAVTHDKKSHDYASNNNPYGNYLFAGELSRLFNNPRDAGFIGRVGEKLYRLANLENGQKVPQNETIEDTERDIVTIIALWISCRRDSRPVKQESSGGLKSNQAGKYQCKQCGIDFSHEPIRYSTLREDKYYFCRELCRDTWIKMNQSKYPTDDLQICKDPTI